VASTASALLAVVFIDPAAAQTVPETSAPEMTISDPEATTAVESTGDVPTGTTTPSTTAVLVVPSPTLPPPVSIPPQTTLAAPEESAPPASTPGTTEVTSASTTTPATTTPATTTPATTTTATTTTTSAPPPVLTVLSGPDPCLTGCDLGTGLIFRQWHLEPLGVTSPPSISAEGALIAVVDGGIRLDHPDLIGNVRRPACAPGVNSDLHLEHGTNVAGLIAPISFDAAGLGPAVPGITILDIPIVGFDGEGRTIASAAVVAAGVRCAVAEGADVINLSITGSCADADELQAAIAEAELAGAVVVAAAGNASLLAPPCPAAFDTVLSAGATSEVGDVAIGTQWADVMLPGIELMTASASDSRPRTLVTGTSFAAPLLSATIAALITEHPGWTPARVRARVIATAIDDVPWLPDLMSAKPGVVAVTRDGVVTSLGDAAVATRLPTSQAVDLVVGPCSELWVAAADGGVFTSGGAAFHGSLGGVDLAAPVVAIATSDDGYWLFAADGGVFTFGTAQFHGSLGAIAISSPIVDAAVTSSGAGYWLLGADGQVYTFGDAERAGAIIDSAQNMVAIERVDGGYVLFRSDGRVVRLGSRLQGWNVDVAGSVLGGYMASGAPFVFTAGGEVRSAADASRLVGSPMVAAAQARDDIECSDQQ